MSGSQLFVKARYALALTGVALVAATTIVFVVFTLVHHELRGFTTAVAFCVTLVVALPICIYESNQHFNLQLARDALAEKGRELAEARDAAERAHRAKTQFLANMSHEIRTPMNGVVGMASLLAETSLDARQREMVGVILGSGDSLLRIINDILDFSRIEAGKLAIVAEPFDFGAAVEEIGVLMAIKAREKDIELTMRYQAGLARKVVGDEGRLRQILTNLVGNAVKFTDKGSVAIDVSGASRDGEIEFAISVSDTGCGIPADKIAAVFEKFEQADGSRERRFDGAGLGLAISKSLIESMGGSIRAESELGRGSVFTATLALPRCLEVDDRASNARMLAGLRVLVVDDNEANRSVLDEQLRAVGAETLLASCGSEALALAAGEDQAARRVDLLVIDSGMPDMDGRRLAEAFRKDPSCCDAPRILMASGGATGDAIPGDDDLFAAFVHKPVREAALFAAIAEVVGAAGAAELRMPRRQLQSSQRLSDSEAPAAGLRVLVAEDNAVNRMVLDAMLKNLGCEAVFAGDGIEAVEHFGKEPPDLVLMDLSMPRLGGEEAARMIRALQNEGARRCPIIAATAHALPEHVERIRDAGMDDVITKPIRLESLAAILWKWSAGDRAPSQRNAAG